MSALAPLSAIVAIWKMLQHARALANDGAGEDVHRLGETIARIEQVLDRHAVARPLLDLVEVAIVRIERSRVSSSDQSLTARIRDSGGASLPWADDVRAWSALPPPDPPATAGRFADPQCRGAVAPEPPTRCNPAKCPRTRKERRGGGSPCPH